MATIEVEFATSDGSPGVVYTLAYADEAAILDAKAKDIRIRIAKEFGLPVAPARLRLLLGDAEPRTEVRAAVCSRPSRPARNRPTRTRRAAFRFDRDRSKSTDSPDSSSATGPLSDSRSVLARCGVRPGARLGALRADARLVRLARPRRGIYLTPAVSHLSPALSRSRLRALALPRHTRSLSRGAQVLDRKARGRDFPLGGLKDGGRLVVRVGPAPKVPDPDSDDEKEAKPEPKRPSLKPVPPPSDDAPPEKVGGINYDYALKEDERKAQAAADKAAAEERAKASQGPNRTLFFASSFCSARSSSCVLLVLARSPCRATVVASSRRVDAERFVALGVAAQKEGGRTSATAERRARARPIPPFARRGGRGVATQAVISCDDI